MPRKKITKKKEVLVDPMYNSSILAKLITKVMYSGKKNLAQQIVYGAMDTIQEKMKEDPLKVITKAIENVRPQVETRSRRVGGATYQVPMEVRKERSYSLGIRWLVDYARERGGTLLPRKAGRRDHGRLQREGRRHEEAGNRAQDGRIQPRLRPLPLVGQRGQQGR